MHTVAGVRSLQQPRVATALATRVLQGLQAMMQRRGEAASMMAMEAVSVLWPQRGRAMNVTSRQPRPTLRR
jgi:hypothetical protein